MIRTLIIGFAVALALVSETVAQGYLIRIGDTLDISVLEDPGLNRQVLVRPDGRISLPLAGTLDAAGRTPEALQVDVRRRLASNFVEPPTVDVAVTGLSTQPVEEAAVATIYVVGEVNNPGSYDVELPIDILQALALSGGPGVFAARKRIQVRRRGSDGETVFLFDYDSVADGTVPSPPISLVAGDVIVVPERGLFE